MALSRMLPMSTADSLEMQLGFLQPYLELPTWELQALRWEEMDFWNELFTTPKFIY
jgi:hypothetical protein